MKEPRVTDFDPKSARSLRSPLDDMPAIGSQNQNIAQPASETFPTQTAEEVRALPGSTSVATPGGPPVRTPVRVKRTLTRYAFEFFQDQIESLKKFSIEEHIRGEKGSMSQMVREAIDAYIAKRKQVGE